MNPRYNNRQVNDILKNTGSDKDGLTGRQQRERHGGNSCRKECGITRLNLQRLMRLPR